MPCIETTSESRPKRVTNHGTPAAGMKTPLANVGSSSWSEAMSSWAWSHARRTVWLGVSRRTRRSCGWPWSGNGSATALHGSVLGRRFELVSGSQRRQVCQTPLGATSAMNTNRPLANWGLLSERSAWMTSSRTNSRWT